ncbi:arrestin domain-containing protein 3-like isoform X2 [Mercenaria mercenaria]|uniref:arrestin domain-containing protein 3-like isoform X2 n=1 Tax=Mercenaria mercenaria TaxID=6596 RepID=UPI00234ECC0F|nr:arrestin domain-containing protein 3-like isoform X2 [Mercenaria mercenaria]
MGKKEVFQIILDNPSEIFYPDQLVSAINVIFKGFANVRWSEGGGDKRRTYSSTEKYFHTKVCLFGKEQTGKDDVKLKPDKYSYPFSFQLAKGLPSSYEAKIGRVRYTLKAHIDIPWAFDKYTKRLITVVNLLDLNAIPGAMNGSSKTDEKTLCCLCCKSDPITATVMLDRTGYVPGESVVFRAEINNRSDREMTCSSAKLVMLVLYHATSKTKKVNNVLFELKHGKIDGGGTDIWMNEKLHIPPVPPSYLQGCNIIDIRYYVMITVDPSGAGFDLNVPLEVVIGSIPLSSIAEQHGMVLPQQPQATLLQPSPGAPKGIYSATAMPTNLPQATLVESAMGRVNTTEDDDTKETTGNTDFAPVYTYYNWDKPDPKNTFTVQCQ